MIYGQIWARTAVLTPVPVTPEYIFSWENDLFEGYFYKEYQSDYTRVIKWLIYGVYDFCAIVTYYLRFSEVRKYKCASYITDSKGFVILI